MSIPGLLSVSKGSFALKDCVALGRLYVYNVLQESDKLLAGVARGGLPEHLAGLRIQGRIERQRPVPVIFKAVLLGPSWG